MLLQCIFYCLSMKMSSSASIADQFLDLVLSEHLNGEIRNLNLDPAPLPDFGIPFKVNVLPIPISGRVDFYNGVLNGLAKIRRFASCDGPTISFGDVKFECSMTFFGMDAVYDVRARIEQLPPLPFQVTAYVNETIVKSGISGVPTSLKGNLDLFEITKFGDINVRLSNLGVFQTVYNAVEEEFREEVRSELTGIILNQFPVAFTKAIGKVRLPRIVI